MNRPPRIEQTMLHRMIGFAVVLFWTIATGWLVWHDILPAWTAQDPPGVVAADWVKRYGRRAQFGIYDNGDRRIGGIWTRYTSGSATDREDEIFIDDLALIGPTYVHIKSVFDVRGRLDEIDISLLGAWNPIRIRGERFPSQFAFKVEAGTVRHVFKIDAAFAGTFSATFRPFDAMPDLTVGQSWHMQIFNPVAAVTGVGDEFIPVLVKVVGTEMFHVGGQPRDCLIVEAPNVRAWVERRSGVVLRQQIDLPVGGTITINFEPYDELARRRAAGRFDRYQVSLNLDNP